MWSEALELVEERESGYLVERDEGGHVSVDRMEVARDTRAHVIGKTR